jgi:hypothetical protein
VNGRDPHSALKSDPVTSARHAHMEAVVARLQWGKNDIAYSLHVNPTAYTTSGLQTTDFLSYLGFRPSDRCSFTGFQRCYVTWVPEGFDPESFLAAFESAYAHLQRAESGLGACGFALPQPQGWGFFFDRDSRGNRERGPKALSGDGHTARKSQSMKQTEDESFLFRFTFIETDHDKGFITHYRPKHPPLSSELRSVFSYLGLRSFQECPEFDFEPCFYRSLRFESRGDDYGFFNNNTEEAHRGFDAHATRFSGAIRDLLAANEAIETIGMNFLPFEKPADRLKADIDQKILRPPKPAPTTIATTARDAAKVPSNFDVAISVAGSDKQHAQGLAERLRQAGFAVFYYEFYPEYLWGKNLATTFDEIFRKRSRFCVVFVSAEYRARVWTSLEMRSAQARAVAEKGNEYILPIRIDDTELEGLLPTISYLPIGMGIGKIGDLLIRKLQS